MSLRAEVGVHVLGRLWQFTASDFEMEPVSTTVDVKDATAADGARRCLFSVYAHEP
jgi:hypothetical protein